MTAAIVVVLLSASTWAQTVVTFATWAGGNEHEIWERDIAAFERENPDIKVELISTGWGTYWDRLPLMLSGNVEVDVIRLGGQHIPTFAHSGYLLPLTKYDDEGSFERNAFFSPVLETAMYSGVLYGLPDHFSPRVLYFNIDMFERYGLVHPHALHEQNAWTWSSFEEVGRKLTVDRAGDGFIDQWGVGTEFSPTQAHVRQSMILMNGGLEYDPSLTRLLLNQTESVEALHWLAGLAPLSGGVWTNGRVGMTNGWPSTARAWQPGTGSLPFEFGVAPLPRPDDKEYQTVMTSNIMSILTTSKNPEAALRFINFIVGTDVQRVRVDDNYVVSARIDVAHESLEEGRLIPRFTPVIAEITAFSRPWDVPLFHYDAIPQLVSQELARMARGEESAAGAAERITRMVNAILESE